MYKITPSRRVSTPSECVRKAIEKIARHKAPVSPTALALNLCCDLLLVDGRVAVTLRGSPKPGSIVLKTTIMRGCAVFSESSHALDATLEVGQ